MMSEKFMEDLRTRPSVDRPGLPRARREWKGKRVALRYIAARGDYWSRTSIRWIFGTLEQASADHLVAVREGDGTLREVHYRRVTTLYNMSERKPATP